MRWLRLQSFLREQVHEAHRRLGGRLQPTRSAYNIADLPTEVVSVRSLGTGHSLFFSPIYIFFSHFLLSAFVRRSGFSFVALGSIYT